MGVGANMDASVNMTASEKTGAKAASPVLAAVRGLVRGVPVPIAGVALGVVALGNLLQPEGGAVHATCGVVSALLVLLLLAKLVSFPHMIADDMRHPIFGSVSATLFMSVMQLATYVAPYAQPVALGMWWLAVACHAALIVWFTALALANFKLADVYPTYFICYVGIVVGSVTSPAVGMEAVGRVLFVFGFACYAVLLALVTYRYARHPVPEPARPLVCIYAAPMSLSLAGYLSTHVDPSLAFVVALEVLAQALFAVVLTRLPGLLRLRFYPSYAAMTFPFVITAVALGKAIAALRAAGVVVPGALDALLTAETVFAAVMVCYVLVRYVMFLAGNAVVAAREQPVAGAVAVPTRS